MSGGENTVTTSRQTSTAASHYQERIEATTGSGEVLKVSASRMDWDPRMHTGVMHLLPDSTVEYLTYPEADRASPVLTVWDRSARGGQPIEGETSIWNSPRLQQMLKQPLGSSVELTIEEAREVVRSAFGSRPDLPAPAEFLSEVSDALGYSVIDRVRRSHG